MLGFGHVSGAPCSIVPAGQVAHRELHEQRMAARQAYEARAFHDKVSFQGVAAASQEEVAEMSARLNAQMVALEGDPQKRSWFKLFKARAPHSNLG